MAAESPGTLVPATGTFESMIFQLSPSGGMLARWWFQIFLIFTPNPGEMIQFDEHIFQMGWFNHQL